MQARGPRPASRRPSPLAQGPMGSGVDVETLGYTVEAFSSAADFLESRSLSETACLIADVHMPGMTGVELHGRLIKFGYAIPTILLTAFPEEGVRDRAFKDGVLCYLGSRWTTGISSGGFGRL